MRLKPFIILLLIVCACGENNLDGPVENHYENGQLMSKISYKNGYPDGPSETYHQNGQLRSKGKFEMGQVTGVEESYYENGQLWSKSSYKEGKRHGPDEYYDIYGGLRWQGSYDMGRQCGEWFNDGNMETHPKCPHFDQKFREVKDAHKTVFKYNPVCDPEILATVSGGPSATIEPPS